MSEKFTDHSISFTWLDWTQYWFMMVFCLTMLTIQHDGWGLQMKAVQNSCDVMKWIFFICSGYFKSEL